MLGRSACPTERTLEGPVLSCFHVPPKVLSSFQKTSSHSREEGRVLEKKKKLGKSRHTHETEMEGTKRSSSKGVKCVHEDRQHERNAMNGTSMPAKGKCNHACQA